MDAGAGGINHVIVEVCPTSAINGIMFAIDSSLAAIDSLGVALKVRVDTPSVLEPVHIAAMAYVVDILDIAWTLGSSSSFTVITRIKDIVVEEYS